MKATSNSKRKPRKYWKLELLSRISFLYLNESFRYPFILKVADRKHKLVIKHLERKQSNIIEKYRNIREKEVSLDHERYIWTLWWQGEENAPELVRICLKQLRKNANGAKVVLISKDNYKDYIELPKHIIEKKEAGYISIQQLSDILRFTLLEKYGGLWLDSTIYTSKPIPREYFEYHFFSQHTQWQDTCFVQHNLWHGFCIGSQPGGKLVSFAKEMFFDYWKKENKLVDYLMIDYIIMLAYQQYPDIKEEIDTLPYSSERLYDLVGLLSDEYDRDSFDKLMDECIFSKLDWHKEYRTVTVDGKGTNYSHIAGL